MTANDPRCRCGSGQVYQQCCQPFHESKAVPKTAEQLMRSRYTAFCLNIDTYLTETLLPDNRLAKNTPADSTTTWIQLSIIKKQQGAVEDTEGTVEFIATFEEDGGFFELHENSNFVKQKNRWFYMDGEPKVSNITLKWKRNDPCWCHSGLKYKKCHG